MFFLCNLWTFAIWFTLEGMVSEDDSAAGVTVEN
jgi:hypothetical protein